MKYVLSYFHVISIFAMISFSEEVVLKLQNGVNGYAGTQDICIYGGFDNQGPLIHYKDGTFKKDSPEMGLGFYDC